LLNLLAATFKHRFSGFPQPNSKIKEILKKNHGQIEKQTTVSIENGPGFA
jgi:hypothetical protein